MPSNLLDESDYSAGSGPLSGDRVFKNADPATTAREQTFNTLWHNLRTFLKGFQISGDLTAANYAADLAAGFPNLAKAIMRAGRRMLSANIANVTVSEFTLVLTPTQDVFCYHLVDPAGPTPAQPTDSIIVPVDTDNTNQKGRLILIVNKTADYRLVGCATYQRYVRLAPLESCWFYAMDDGAYTAWMGIGRQFLNLESPEYFSVRCYDGGASGTMSDAVDMSWSVYGHRDRVMTINVPTTSVTMTTTASGVVIAPDGYVDFDDFYLPIGGGAEGPSPLPLVYGLIDSDRQMFVGSFLGGKLTFYPVSGIAPGIGAVVTISAFSFTYIRDP